MAGVMRAATNRQQRVAAKIIRLAFDAAAQLRANGRKLADSTMDIVSLI